MRVTRLSVLVFAVVTLFAALPGHAAQKTIVTATDIGDPFGIFGPPTGYYDFSKFTLTCPGHEPTGNPLQPCPVGSRANWRGLVVAGVKLTSQDPRFNDGLETVEININYDANGQGPFWGKSGSI